MFGLNGVEDVRRSLVGEKDDAVCPGQFAQFPGRSAQATDQETISRWAEGYAGR